MTGHAPHAARPAYRALRIAGAFALSLTLLGLLLAAALVGDARRCDALERAGSPLTTTYCPGSPR